MITAAFDRSGSAHLCKQFQVNVGPMLNAQRFLGMDFSGAAQAGRAIWVAEGRARAAYFEVESVMRADRLLGCEALRESVLPALRGYLGRLGEEAVIGCDFSFSLPAQVMHGRPWVTYISNFGVSFRTADAMRESCRRLDGGVELKRE